MKEEQTRFNQDMTKLVKQLPQHFIPGENLIVDE
jgi:hypothetical protein